ncbi:MAG: hypothetical protein AB1656_06980 [Candidatus Omnitrophota bacterium]
MNKMQENTRRFCSFFLTKWGKLWAAALVMALLGISYFWWMNFGPDAPQIFWERAMNRYQEAEARGGDWTKSWPLWEAAALALEKFLHKFPQHPHRLEAALNLANACYQIGDGLEKTEEKERSREYFQRMADNYERYLILANKTQPQTEADASDGRRAALLSLALAQRKLGHLGRAVELMEDAARQYPDTADGFTAWMDIGDLYRDWAKIGGQWTHVLGKAIWAYGTALEKMPENDHANRIRAYARRGDAQRQLYEFDSNQPFSKEDACIALKEAISEYEKAAEEARKIAPPAEAIHYPSYAREFCQTLVSLGDLYLIKGQKFDSRWAQLSESKKQIRDDNPFKESLIKSMESKWETSQSCAEKALALFEEILAQKEHLFSLALGETCLGKARAYFLLRDYSRALAAGEEAVAEGYLFPQDAEVRLYYILGDSAWECVQAGSGGEKKAMQYYRQALELDLNFPRLDNGYRSQIARSRLTEMEKAE